jgi:hypothetical protein
MGSRSKNILLLSFIIIVGIFWVGYLWSDGETSEEGGDTPPGPKDKTSSALGKSTSPPIAPKVGAAAAPPVLNEVPKDVIPPMPAFVPPMGAAPPAMPQEIPDMTAPPPPNPQTPPLLPGQRPY